jgi:hypothetical protein
VYQTAGKTYNQDRVTALEIREGTCRIRALINARHQFRYVRTGTVGGNACKKRSGRVSQIQIRITRDPVRQT